MTTTRTPDHPAPPSPPRIGRDSRQPVHRASRPVRRGEAGPFHLGRFARKVVLTAHVVSSVGWFGVALTVAFVGIYAAATADAALPLALHQAMRTTIWLSVPIGLIAAVTGVVLSLGTKWGLTRYRWVIIKEVITLVVIVTDPLVLLPAIGEAMTTGEASAPFGPMIAHCVMLSVATILSVFKPLGRRGERRS